DAGPTRGAHLVEGPDLQRRRRGSLREDQRSRHRPARGQGHAAPLPGGRHARALQEPLAELYARSIAAHAQPRRGRKDPRRAPRRALGGPESRGPIRRAVDLMVVRAPAARDRQGRASRIASGELRPLTAPSRRKKGSHELDAAFCASPSRTHSSLPQAKGTFLLCIQGGHFYFALTKLIVARYFAKEAAKIAYMEAEQRSEEH